MPINKRQKTTVRKKPAKKPEKNKTLLLAAAIAAVFIIILITGYVFFKGPSDLTTDSSKKGTGLFNVDGQGVPVADRGFQAAVEKAKLQLESVDNRDMIKVIVEKTTGANNKEIMYAYEWSINGQPMGNGSDSISGFKRGDKVSVKITPFDEEKTGQPRTLVLDVQNTTPKVSPVKEPKYDGKVFTAQINASDPDGDTLSYELLTGPEGMTLDKKSGAINWIVKEDKTGDYPVKVKISDGHGGETMYELTATIPKELPVPETPPKKTP